MMKKAPLSEPLDLSVLVVDDVEEMRLLVEEALVQIPGVRISGSAQNGAEARVELYRRRPQVVLLDEILPGESSIDLIEEFIQAGVAVLLMTSVENPTHSLPPNALARVVKPGWKRTQVELKKLEEALRLAKKNLKEKLG